ncbi:response regulator transcription factor [Rhizobium sp. NZLR1]|uniref:response regulator transcription factor n=1 Tax=Rhizobium sp. NZLR1 TaxID=2731096 RepID=UPI001A98B743|nr:response regulator transcription factor [Rhizobium sp. NZLR1]MBX5204681.1 response regulator transcription factor [Rhizobium sp. NZLR1]QSZ23402.1 response regulator transcription factor [Rhizobium sp. NZLR1]
MRILLIEDSARLRGLLCEAIRDEGWKIDAFETAQEGRVALREGEYDLLLLDLGLPDEDGIDVLKSLRDAGTQTPVLALTARGAIDERIAGLDAGADDYLAKPFHNGELTARIRALIRRSPVTSMPGLLELLMRNGGKVVAKARIEHTFSEFGDERSSNAVELAVSRLRKRLERHNTHLSIETIRGVSYLMREVRD